MTILRARFHGQAWVNDNAVEVPDKTEEWVVTPSFIDGLREKYTGWTPEEFRENLFRSSSLSDEVAEDEAAPTWVQNWSGPFWVDVTEEECGEHDGTEWPCPTCDYCEIAQCFTADKKWNGETGCHVDCEILALHSGPVCRDCMNVTLFVRAYTGYELIQYDADGMETGDADGLDIAGPGEGIVSVRCYECKSTNVRDVD